MPDIQQNFVLLECLTMLLLFSEMLSHWNFCCCLNYTAGFSCSLFRYLKVKQRFNNWDTTFGDIQKSIEVSRMQNDEQEKDKKHESKIALSDSMFWSVSPLRTRLIRETSWGAIMNVSSIIRNIYLIIYEFVTKWLSFGLAWFLRNIMHYLLKRTFDDIVDSVFTWIISILLKNNLAQIRDLRH